MMYDRSNCGSVTVDETMHMLYARYGKDRFVYHRAVTVSSSIVLLTTTFSSSPRVPSFCPCSSSYPSSFHPLFCLALTLPVLMTPSSCRNETREPTPPLH